MLRDQGVERVTNGHGGITASVITVPGAVTSAAAVNRPNNNNNSIQQIDHCRHGQQGDSYNCHEHVSRDCQQQGQQLRVRVLATVNYEMRHRHSDSSEKFSEEDFVVANTSSGGGGSNNSSPYTRDLHDQQHLHVVNTAQNRHSSNSNSSGSRVGSGRSRSAVTTTKGCRV